VRGRRTAPAEKGELEEVTVRKQLEESRKSFSPDSNTVRNARKASLSVGTPVEDHGFSVCRDEDSSIRQIN
jgi:hypothetical protein